MIDKINQLDIEQIVQTLGIKYKKIGHTISFYENGKLTDGWKADLVKGVFSDFSGKGRASGDRLDFVMKYLNVTKAQAFSWMEKTFNLEKEKHFSSPTRNVIAEKWENFGEITEEQILYLKERAISYEFLGHNVLREYKGNICLPIRNLDGNIKSLQSRSIKVDASSRYYVEANTDSDGLFFSGIDATLPYLIVLEGLTDFLSVRQYTTNVVGLVNAKNTTQIDYIKELSKKYEIFFIPDNDEAGLTTIEKFKERNIKCSTFKLETYGVKDINEALVNYGLGEEILTIIFSESERPLSNLRRALSKAKEYKKLYEQNNGRLGFESGYPLIDKYIDGIIKGKVYLIMAYSNLGKSRFAYSLVKNIVKQKKKVVFYSLEVDAGMLFLELIGAITGKTKQQVLDGLDELDIIEIEKYVEVYDDVRKLEEIENHIKNNNYDVAFIDFVQNIEHTGNEYEKTTDIAIRIQKLAIVSGTTIFSISQVNNESRFAEGNNIMPKGSGALFASSDVILSLWGKENKKFLTIAKNKYGQAGINLILEPNYSTSSFAMAEDFGEEAKGGGNSFKRF